MEPADAMAAGGSYWLEAWTPSRLGMDASYIKEQTEVTNENPANTAKHTFNSKMLSEMSSRWILPDKSDNLW